MKIFSKSSKQRKSSSFLNYICCTSNLTRFLLVALGFLILFQTERQALRKVLQEVNVDLMEERYGGGFSNGDDGHYNPLDVHKRTSFSACLVLANEHENQYLVEWLAYHYHVLPLRRLIVWKDPLCETSPDEILARWNHTANLTAGLPGINITVWNHTDQIYPPGHPYHKNKRHRRHYQDLYDYEQKSELLTHHDKMGQRNKRQAIFFGACLRRLKREGRSWAMLSHTDEYTLINPRIRDRQDPLHVEASLIPIEPHNASSATIQLTIPAQNESGSVLKWLHRTQPYSYANPRYILSQPCIPLTSKQFGTRELPDLENRTTILGNHSAVSYGDFLTLRWQYWGHPEHHIKAPVVRKSYVDLSRIPMSLLHWKIDSHRPVPHDDICPRTQIHETDSLFVTHHYSGTTERLKHGNTAKDGIHSAVSHNGLKTEQRLHQDKVHNTFFEGNVIPQWLDGFVDSVGLEEAQKLLEGVGQLH